MESDSLKEIYLQAPAKINLGLFIVGKRSDGYHLLQTLLYPLDQLVDDIHISLADHNDCKILSEGIEIDCAQEDNLCYKAYHLWQNEIGPLPGITIKINKRIPAGAGLGGGSSNAATTLLGIRQLCHPELQLDLLASLAARLGADIPFFLYQKPMLAKGIGTELIPFELELPYEIRLITPPIHSSTVSAYKAMDYRQFDHERDLTVILNQAFSTWKQKLDNDLEVPVFAMYPELKVLKEQLYEEGAVYAAMSGSGSAVFGLFEK